MKIYMVPTDRWYIERTVWLIAGVVLLASTAMALLMNRLWILGVIATGLLSINVAFTGFCPWAVCCVCLASRQCSGQRNRRAGTYTSCRQTDGILSAASILQWDSISPSRQRWCSFTAHGSLCSRPSLVVRWCGSPRLVFVRWRMDFTG